MSDPVNPRPFIAALPCARCAIQKGETVHAGVRAMPTPWGHIPACADHRDSAATAGAWEKLSTSIDALGASLDRAAARDDRLAARRAFARERNRALGRPLDAAVDWKSPDAAKAKGSRP